MATSRSVEIQASDFDSRVIGKRIANVTIKTGVEETSPSQQEFDLLCAKVPSSAFESIAILEQDGFRHVEGEIDLEVTLETSAPSDTKQANLREAVLSDLDDLKDLASQTMRGLTRLRDPWFTTADSDKMYATWVENAVKGQFDHVCLIMTDGQDRPIGFITIRWLEETAARIGLFGVAEEWRGRGIGSKLFEQAERLCAINGRSKLFVATQTSNTTALQFYQRRGALIIATGSWYYKRPNRTLDQGKEATGRECQPGASVLSLPPKGLDSLERVKDVLEQDLLGISGKYSRGCERLFEKMYGHDRILLTTSGTLALHLAALAIDVQPGDEVIMPTFTYVSTVNAFTMRGATPVFVDIDYTSMNIDVSLVEEAMTSKTRAIVAVHYAGVSCDMDRLIDIARSNGLYLIEDAAQGLGSTYKRKALGSIGDIGCLSFHGTKIVTSGGQGGAVIVNNPALLRNIQRAFWHGTNRCDFMEGLVPEYTWTGPGYNSQMPEILAALLHSQLLVLPELVRHNQRGYGRYYGRLSPLAKGGGIGLPTTVSKEHNAHIFHIKVVDATRRDALRQYLKERGISSQPHYSPLHSTREGLCCGRYVSREDVASRAASQLLRLPLHTGMGEKEIDEVVAAVESFVLQVCE